MLRAVGEAVCCSIRPMTNPSNLRARIASGRNWSCCAATSAGAPNSWRPPGPGGTYDFIWLDSQHSPYSDHHLVSFSASAEQLGIPVQLRIPHTREAHKVGRFFDLGITGALVPEVMEESTVQDAIDFAYYGPIGRRSWGGVNRLGLRNHAAPTARRAYADWWNATVLLSIQIESVETVRNIARLVRPEITHVTWGPNDLEFSLEKHSDPALNSVEACMRHVAKQLEGSGIRMSMGTASMPEERQTFREIGVTIFQASS